MATTFADCYREVRLHASAVPLFLCRAWVNAAYESLCRYRSWSFLRGELTLSIRASRSVTVTVTQASATVTSAAAFVATDAGRNLRLGLGPVYTILEVVDASTITLDRAYTEIDATSTTGTILDAYATMPADFSSFRVIPDRYNRRVLAFWLTEDQLVVVDPDRSRSDTGPRCLVACSPSPYTATLGRVRYEYWPAPTSARSYPALYNKQASALSETSLFSGVLADAQETLVSGALARAATWPGTADVRNPYFNLELARAHRADFDLGVQRLALKDDTQAPEDLSTVDWARWPVADLGFDDHALRASDASVGAYY